MERSEVIKAVNSGDAIMAFQAGLSEGINLAVDHLVRFANLNIKFFTSPLKSTFTVVASWLITVPVPNILLVTFIVVCFIVV